MTPPKPKGCPFAPPISGGLWPVLTTHPKRLEVTYRDINGDMHGSAWGRSFGADRPNGRHHCGVDLWGHHGSDVQAITEGKVVRVAPFVRGVRAKGGTPFVVYSVLIDCGPILVRLCELGAIQVKAGDLVHPGSPIGKVWLMKRSQMCHTELWQAGSKPQPWRGKDPPKGLLDPTAMLLALAEDARSGNGT